MWCTLTCAYFTLRIQAYGIYWEFSFFKINFQNNFDIFYIFAQNIDCGYTLFNEYPQYMSWIKA